MEGFSFCGFRFFLKGLGSSGPKVKNTFVESRALSLPHSSRAPPSSLTSKWRDPGTHVSWGFSPEAGGVTAHQRKKPVKEHTHTQNKDTHTHEQHHTRARKTFTHVSAQKARTSNTITERKRQNDSTGMKNTNTQRHPLPKRQTLCGTSLVMTYSWTFEEIMSEHARKCVKPGRVYNTLENIS